MALRFAEIDVYALLDSDSDDAKAFTTYLGYWVALAAHVQDGYPGDRYAGILAALAANKAYRRMASRPGPADESEAIMRSLLLNGWASELRLHLIDIEDTSKLWLANHGAPIDSYYATSRHATAFLQMRATPTPRRRIAGCSTRSQA